MRSRCLLFAALLSFSLLTFGFDTQKFDCEVHVAMANGSRIPPNLRLQLFDQETRLVETVIPVSGTVSLPPLPPGHYRVQVGGGATNLVTTGPLHATVEPCLLAMSIEGRSESANRIEDDDLDVEDLRVSARVRTLFHAAFADLQRGDLETARNGFLQLIKLDPKLSRAYNILGVISDQLGDNQAGRLYFEKALELNPRSKTALMNCAKLSMMEHRYSDALALLERARSGTRENADVHAMEAIAYLRLNRFPEAIREAQAVHALPHANWANIHVVAASAYERLHETAAAIREYRQYLEESAVEATRVIVARKIQALSEPTGGKATSLPMDSFVRR